ncbi:MAG: hypothetical protein U9Q30_03050 [Campylobacterota bacterium]|nr:hypothetical protein [Campylobacterota bacterium]
MNTVAAQTNDLIKSSKRSLDSLLRDRAYEEVKEYLKEKDIDITKVSDEDIEVLIEAKVRDMNNTLKGVAIGGAFAFVVSSIFGI